eukprot:scaffold5770_cov388-Prasinococcus_capsulatus_cf.AAC.7
MGSHLGPKRPAYRSGRTLLSFRAFWTMPAPARPRASRTPARGPGARLLPWRCGRRQGGPETL